MELSVASTLAAGCAPCPTGSMCSKVIVTYGVGTTQSLLNIKEAMGCLW